MGKDDEQKGRGSKIPREWSSKSKNMIHIPPPIYKWRSVPKNQEEREEIIHKYEGKAKKAKGSDDR